MATAGTSCVVWEWQRDDGGFSPYPPETSSQIETAFSSYSGSGSYVMTDYTIHFSTMRQKKNVSGYERAIRRTALQLPASPDVKAYWVWNEYGVSYALYSVNASTDIELAHQKGLSSVNLSACPCRLPYTINFTSMDQTRHGYGTKRKIQRHPLSVSLQSLLQPKTTAASSASSTAMGSSPSFTIGSSSPSKSSGKRGKSKAASGSDGGGKPKGRLKESTGVATTSSSKSSDSGASAVLSSGDPGIAPYAKKILTLKPADDGPCPICMSQLSELSGFEEEERPLPPIPLSPPLDVYQLRKCEHMMHHACLLMYMKNCSDSGFQCPTCKKVYGVKMGNMPDGTMKVTTNKRSSLPGHEGYGTIQITYDFKPGMHNGQRYRTNGFPRVCYLPDSPKGQKVLKLLKIAWERRLTFTIATSVTTGATDTVVWNEIHHKTESTSNHSGHGYPDPNYLDNVLMELAAQGVEDISEPETISISSDSDSDL